MASPTTTLSSSTATGTCGKSTTGFATGLPLKRDAFTGPSHHPVLFVPFTESSSKSLSTSLPILLPIIHTPSGHSLSHPGTSGPHTRPRSSSEKVFQSPFVSPQYDATVKLYPSATHPSVPGSLNTAARPLIPNSQVSKSHNPSHARDMPPSNAAYEPFKPSQISRVFRTAISTSSWIPESHQTVTTTVTTTVSETPQSTSPTPPSTTDEAYGQPTISIVSSTTSTGPTTPANGAVASMTDVAASPAQSASQSLSSTGHA